jgi:hypothetical protein
VACAAAIGVLSSLTLSSCGFVDRSSSAAAAVNSALGTGSGQTAATREWLVAYRGGDEDRPELQPAYAAAPLAGGSARTITVPDPASFEPVTLVADDRVAVVVGLRCQDREPRPPPASGGQRCAGAAPAAVRIDPSTGTTDWVDVDPDLAAISGLTLTSPQRTRDGWLIIGAAAPTDPASPDERRMAVVHLTPTSMRLLRTWDGFGHSCTTADAVVQLDRTVPGGQGPGTDLTAPATFGLLRIPLDGTPGTPMPLPDLPADFGGAGVQLACMPDGPLLTSVRILPADAPAGPASTTTTTTFGSPPTPRQVDLRVWQWRDDQWVERPDLVPPTARWAEIPVSDRSGVLLTWAVEPDPARQQVVTVHVPADGGAPQFLGRASGSWWWGESGIRLGARRDLGTQPGEPEGRFPGMYEVQLSS